MKSPPSAGGLLWLRQWWISWSDWFFHHESLWAAKNGTWFTGELTDNQTFDVFVLAGQCSLNCLMFCPTGTVWLHPPWETEEKEELQELWSRLCEELQGRDYITQSSLTQSCQPELFVSLTFLLWSVFTTCNLNQIIWLVEPARWMFCNLQTLPRKEK